MTRPRIFTEDLYAVLGLGPDAGSDDIRRASRVRQRATHPDYGGDAGEFVRVRLAVEVLGDPELRRQHDEWLAGTRAGRRGGHRLRTQQRTPRRRPAPQPTPPPAPRPAARPETPPPDRIPKPVFDVTRMAWARTTWPRLPEQWPPATAVLPPLTGRATAAVIALVAFLVAGAVLFWASWSPARLAWPSLDPERPGGTMWGFVVAYLLLSAGWLVPTLLVRARLLSRMLCIVAVVIAGFVGITTLGGTVFALALGSVAAAGGTGLQSLLALGTALCSILAWVALSARSRTFLQEALLVRLADGSAPAVDDPARVFGTPAQSTMGSGAGISPGVNPMRAVMAQRIVGGALAELLRIPGVRIVHGLRAPGGGPGIVAHAIVAGRRIAFIDDELWAPGRYGIGRDGGIVRDGEPMATSATEFPHAVEAFHRLFGEVAHVRGWLTILPEREGALEVDNGLTWERARLATVESMLREVGDWVAQDGGRVDRLLVRDLLRHRA